MKDIDTMLYIEEVPENNYTVKQTKDMDIRTVNISELVEITSVQVAHGSKHERIHNYLKQVRNPYCFRAGKVAVKISFSNTDDTLEDKLVELMSKL
jgi:hypothetical protein